MLVEPPRLAYVVASATHRALVELVNRGEGTDDFPAPIIREMAEDLGESLEHLANGGTDDGSDRFYVDETMTWLRLRDVFAACVETPEGIRA